MKNKYLLILTIVLAVALVGVSAALVTQTIKPAPSPATSTPVANANTNAPPAVAAHDLIPNKGILNEHFGLTVKWIIPAIDVDSKAVADQLGKTIPAPKTINGEMSVNPAFKHVATITAATDSKYIGDNLYRITTTCGLGEINCIDVLAIADIKGKNLVALERYSGLSFPMSTSGIVNGKLMYPLSDLATVDPSTSITDLQPPNTLALNSSGYLLTTTKAGTGTPNDEKMEPTAQTVDGTNVYTSIGDAAASSGIFWGRLPNGEFIRYELSIPFYTNARIPTIVWNDNSVNTNDYTPFVPSGCDGHVALHLENTDLTGKLSVGGKTSNGEDVYLLSDSNNKIITDLYEQYSNFTDIGQKKTLTGFAASKPVFFWRDPLGRLVRWTESDIIPMADCGKPVVYLYPEKTEQVSVTLGSNIEVTKSEPAYVNGWKVTAKPDGTLTTADGMSYPYLYWDGNGASYETPTTGFVVASKDIKATLTSKLTQLGLNTKEIADFNEFWLPIVTKSPYALISFVPQAEWSAAAPLAISPAPDSLIRVFMDWKPLSAPISIAPQFLPPTPARSGFTAVEWGGLLYKH